MSERREGDARLQQSASSTENSEAPEECHLEAVEYMMKRDATSPTSVRWTTMPNAMHKIDLTRMTYQHALGPACALWGCP